MVRPPIWHGKLISKKYIHPFILYRGDTIPLPHGKIVLGYLLHQHLRGIDLKLVNVMASA